ncbi:unnamed protein product [Orchesella dallaii]|uniref:Uncharacterized protein n=1 Tax=Orchesella dallaii TaxID=48710 RepID=A0ABP1Q707_9HEXA
MAPLVLHSFELHQKAVNLFIPHCFYWDIGKKVWKYESDLRRLRPYYILNFGIMGFTNFLCTVFLIGANLIDPKLFKINQVIMFIFILGASLIILLEDILMLVYGKEFLVAVNWSLSIDRSKSSEKKGVKDCTLKEAIREELGKLGKGEIEKVDVYGICMNYVVGSYIFFGTVIPLLAVYEDWDPAYLFLLAVDSPKIFGLNLASNSLLKGIRFLSMLILMQSAFMSTRAFTLIILSFAQTITKILSYLMECYSSVLPSWDGNFFH